MKKKMISVLIALAVSLSTVLAGASAETQAEAGSAVMEETEALSEETYSEEDITDQKEEIQEEETEDQEDTDEDQMISDQENSETEESPGENLSEEILSEEIPSEEVSSDQSSSEKINSEEEDPEQPEDIQTDIPQEKDSGSGSDQKKSDEIQNISEEPLLFTEENAELLSGDSKEEKELVEQIRDGEIIGVAPAFMGEDQISDSAELSISELSGEGDAAVMALQPGQYHVEKIGRVYCDGQQPMIMQKEGIIHVQPESTGKSIM